MEIRTRKTDLFREVRMNALKNHSLFQAEIDITSGCNAKCFFCYQGDSHSIKKNELSFDEVISLLNDLKKMGCYYISFIGGEPFMRADMIDILDYAKKIGFMISVVTNLQLVNEKQLARICEIGVDRVSVSFHSVDEKTYCNIFHVDRKFYEKALENVIYLIEKKINIGILVTVSDKNFHEMKKIRDFFLSKGIKETNVAFNMLVSGKNEVQSRRPMRELEKVLIESNLPIDSILTKNNNFTCSAGKISCCINSIGDVFPCTFMNTPAGNIREESLENIWNQSHFMRFVRSVKEEHFEKCLQCENNRFCNVCMANNMNETGFYNIPDKSYCEFRKMITRSVIG